MRRLAMRQRRGWLYVELLVAMALAVLVLAVGVSILFRTQKGFERQKNLATTEVQTSRILAFIESIVMSAGTGLPVTWSSGVFVSSTDLSTPSWRNWRQVIQVRQVETGGSLTPAIVNEWGSVLQIFTATPLENTVTIEALNLEPELWSDLRLSLPIESQTVTGTKPGDWLLFPGLTVPVRMMPSLQTGRTVKVKALQPVIVPLAQPVYCLVVLDLRHDQQIVTGDFFDGAGRQPLFRNVESLEFRFNEETLVLDVKVQCIDGLVREKSWRLRH